MMARGALIIVAAAIFGIAAVYYLVPGALELAAMKAREGQYRDARASYETLLVEQGPNSYIVLPLADIYVGQGEDEMARQLLRSYLDENPDDMIVARRFANLLRDNQHQEERIAVLERVAEVTGNLEVWRELEGLYDIYGTPDQRANALLTLAQANEASVGELGFLARLLAARGDREEALAISLSALHQYPDVVALDMAQFHIALALAVDRRDLADEAIATWNRVHPMPGDTLMMSATLEGMGAPELALQTLQGSAGYREGDPTLRLHAFRLGAIAGDPTASFEGLLAWYAEGGLPAEGYGLIVETGAQLSRNDEVFSILSQVPLSRIPAEEQLSAVELATEFLRRDLLEAWRTEAGPEWRALPPLTSARLALGLGDRESAATLATRALEEATTDAQTANAARALAGAGLENLANQTVTELAARHADNGLDADALEPLADAALILGRNEIALTVASELAGRSNKPQDQALYARALTAVGRPGEALRILSQLDARDPSIESAMVAALLAAGERDRLQTLLYQRLTDANLPRERRNDLLGILVDSAPLRAGAEVLVPHLVVEMNGGALNPADLRVRVRALALIDPNAAIPFAEALAGSNLPDDIMLFAGLLKRGGQDARAIEVLSQAAKNARSPAEKAGFVESLVMLGGIETALPLLAELAEADGGEWRYAYEDALRQLGQREVLAAALVRHAEDPALSREERRNLAYSLLELDHKDDAEHIFQALATGEGPASTDTQSLVWLWGPRPEADQIAWMIDEAHRARAEDQAGWVTRLVDAGAPQEAATLADELLVQSNDAALLEAAVRARIILNDREGVDRLLTPALPRFDDAATAERFARYAQEVGAETTASLLYERAADIDPARNESRGLAGIAAFHNREKDRARRLLEEYIAQGGRAVEAAFSLAEIRLEDGDLGRARAGYEAVLVSADRTPNDTNVLRLKALSLLRLKREDEAFAVYSQLLELTPADATLRADAGAALLDAGRIDEAATVLGYGAEIGAESGAR